MRKIICDKCNVVVGVASLVARVTDIHLMNLPKDSDLCYKCTVDYLNWLKEKPTGK